MTLTIKVENGQTSLTGPLADIPLCERLLQEGANALRQHKAKNRGIEFPTPDQVQALTRDANRGVERVG